MLEGSWFDRLIPEVEQRSGATGWCLDPHDLAAAKLIAGRAKDIEFVDTLVASRLIDPHTVRELLLVISDVRSDRALDGWCSLGGSGGWLGWCAWL